MMSLPGGPTKDEILAVALFKLDLRPTDIFADIGCGTGKVSIHAARRVRWVHAVDLREEAVAYAGAEAKSSGITNIDFHCGDAVEILPSLGRMDAAFVGGSKALSPVLSILADQGARSVVVAAVKLETMTAAIATMQDLGIFREAVQVQVSRTHSIGGGLMWKPLDPVTLIVGGGPGCS